MNRVEIINGPNLNLLGTREPEIYGNQSFEDYLVGLKERFSGVHIGYSQSNVEGEIVNLLQAAAQLEGCVGIVLNAAAYTHTSIAIADAIKAIHIPVVLVHVSNVYAREVEKNRFVGFFGQGIDLRIGAQRLRVSGSRIVVLKRIVSLQYGIETRQVWQTGSTRFE